ncbi:cation:proton antiporter [bacterium]|nr:cation:proton antiporter [bacterium]MBU1428273.1 cation:proton antiporter [bacterium]MBU2439694.1 cation:proton antiporter [bacterium]
MRSSKIIRTIAQKLFPFIVLFGFYLISHGHLSPGGGFQGGVVLGTAIILLALSHSIEQTEKKFKSRWLNMLEKLGILTLIFLGFLGIFLGYSFLGNFLPLGNPGQIASGGLMLLLNIAIGIKVAAGVSVIFYALVRYRGEI